MTAVRRSLIWHLQIGLALVGARLLSVANRSDMKPSENARGQWLLFAIK
jgi:hypothetical protein